MLFKISVFIVSLFLTSLTPGLFTKSNAAALLQKDIVNSGPDMPSKSITLAVGGDVNLGRRQNWVTAQNGPAHALEKLDILRDSDLAYINLESAVAAGGTLGVNKNEGGPYYYRGRPEMLAVLERAGIDIVGLANNHSMDYGSEALAEELSYFNQMNLLYAGAGENRAKACAPTVVDVKGVRLALFAIDLTMAPFSAEENRPGTCHFDPADRSNISDFFRTRIEQVRPKVHVVLVTPHWGKNFSRTPSAQIRSIAHDIIEAGADGIFGSSAHVIKGVEVYRGKPILYDTGNLLFDETRDRKRPSALFRLTIRETGIRQIEIHPIRPKFGYTRPAKANHARQVINYIAEKSAELGTTVKLDGAIGIVELDDDTTPALPEPTGKVAPLQAPNTAPGALEVPPQECTVINVPEEARITPVKFGDIELLGLRITPRIMNKRQLVYVETFWRTDRKPETDFWIYTRLKDRQANTKTWYGDHEPCDWNWPTSRWKKEIIYRDRYAVRPPNPLTAGSYVPIIGILDRKGNRRWLKEFNPQTLLVQTTSK